MPERDPAVAPPFDQGVFLLHYNRGREAFQEARYAEARRELENAQRLRPDDADVLNLLGLVYFKTNAFPEAEVIYRRLALENPNVFILHSNLGLILFKQGKLDESEQFLLRSIDLRPNYAKSHLYLGLLYRQRKRFGVAMEHLRFAGADKLAHDVEAEMRAFVAKGTPPPPPKGDQSKVTTQKIPAMTQKALDEASRAAILKKVVPEPVETPVETVPQRTTMPHTEMPAQAKATAAVPPPPPAPPKVETAAHTAARKLQ